MPRYIEIKDYGDICIAEGDADLSLNVTGNTVVLGNIEIQKDENHLGSLTVHGDITAYSNQTVTGNLTVNGDIIANGSSVYQYEGVRAEDYLEVTANHAEIRFPNATQSKIWWTSNYNDSDHGFLLFLDRSEFVGGDNPGENARLSIGVLNDMRGGSTRDAMDIQGGSKLVLNAGAYDGELGRRLGYGPPAASSVSNIELRVNDQVKACVRSDGFFTEGCNESSDASLKTDVKPLDSSFEKLLSLEGIMYRWRDRPPNSPYQIGLIAQAVEPYFPEVVVTDVNGIKSVKYSRLVAPLIEGVKTLSTEIARLRQEMAALKQEVAS